MSMPPGGQPPYDPNQPGYGQQPPSYDPGQGGYGQAAPPPTGGYAQPENHPKATTALVLGIVGLVCCGFVAPFAWSVGKKTVNEIDASGGRYGGRGQAQAGYILGIVGTVLLILGLLFFVLAAITGGLSFSAGTSNG
jgi:hypothetical protein